MIQCEVMVLARSESLQDRLSSATLTGQVHSAHFPSSIIQHHISSSEPQSPALSTPHARTEGVYEAQLPQTRWCFLDSLSHSRHHAAR